MSFFDNSKNAGIALIVAGIIQMIAGVITIVMPFVNGDTILIGVIAAGVAGIISGFIFFGFGKGIYGGEVTQKWDIVTRFVLTIGTVTIIQGLFGLGYIVDAVLGNADFGAVAVAAIITLVLGFIICWVYKQMTNGKVNGISKILWVLLLVIFVICILLGVVSIISFTIDGIIGGIANVIIYVFMTIAMLDSEVKDKMM